MAAVFLLVCFCSHWGSPFLLFFTNFAVSASKICVSLSPCFLIGILYLCLSSLLLSSMEGIFYSSSSSCPLWWAVIYHLSYSDSQVATLTKVRPRGEICVRLCLQRNEKLVAVLLSELHSKAVQEKKGGVTGKSSVVLTQGSNRVKLRKVNCDPYVQVFCSSLSLLWFGS